MTYMETDINPLTPALIRQFWPDACDREIEVRMTLDVCYKMQSEFGKGLDLYSKIRELDDELMGFIRARK